MHDLHPHHLLRNSSQQLLCPCWHATGDQLIRDSPVCPRSPEAAGVIPEIDGYQRQSSPGAPATPRGGSVATGTALATAHRKRVPQPTGPHLSSDPAGTVISDERAGGPGQRRVAPVFGAVGCRPDPGCPRRRPPLRAGPDNPGSPRLPARGGPNRTGLAGPPAHPAHPIRGRTQTRQHGATAASPHADRSWRPQTAPRQPATTHPARPAFPPGHEQSS